MLDDQWPVSTNHLWRQHLTPLAPLEPPSGATNSPPGASTFPSKNPTTTDRDRPRPTATNSASGGNSFPHKNPPPPPPRPPPPARPHPPLPPRRIRRKTAV